MFIMTVISVIRLKEARISRFWKSSPSQLEISLCTDWRLGVIRRVRFKSSLVICSFCAKGCPSGMNSPHRSFSRSLI